MKGRGVLEHTAQKRRAAEQGERRSLMGWRIFSFTRKAGSSGRYIRRIPATKAIPWQ